MSKILLAALLLLLHSPADMPVKMPFQKRIALSVTADSCTAFNNLNSKVRDGLIKKQDAIEKFKELLLQIKNYYYKKGGKDIAKKEWVFPLQGYTAKATGGTNGNGYSDAGYNFFDGNKHLAHPAYDIFIHDSNQDGTDDVTRKPVNVLSITAGIVVAIENSWDTTSSLRGGKYIMVYDPSSASLIYYAHNNKLLVGLCDIVKPGDVIATVGRTGYNAFKKRSPTHLHIMKLVLDNNYFPKPVAFYNDLAFYKTLQ